MHGGLFRSVLQHGVSLNTSNQVAVKNMIRKQIALFGVLNDEFVAILAYSNYRGHILFSA